MQFQLYCVKKCDVLEVAPINVQKSVLSGESLLILHIKPIIYHSSS